MLTAKGSALVAGSVAQTIVKTQQVRVIRSFLHAGRPTVAGEVITVPASVAAELVVMTKAERVAELPTEPEAKADDLGEASEQPRRRGRPPKVKE